jgi:WD40 repeat protein
MTPRARFVLRWTFILTFLLIAPAIILSTAGYRYNFGKNRPERTGVLILDSEPAGADIVLNDKAHHGTTPARISRLLPGTYRVRLEKDGFQPFVRDIEITSSQTTFLNDAVLFREGLPLLEKEAIIRRSAFSPDGRYLAAVVADDPWTDIRVYDLRGGDERVLYRAETAAQPPFEFSWSADAKRLLVTRPRKDNPSFFFWDATFFQKELEDLHDVAYKEYRQAFWSAEGDLLYAADDELLYEIDTRSRTIRESGPSVPGMQVMGGAAYGLPVGKDGTTTVARRWLKDDVFTMTQTVPSGDWRPLAGSSSRPTYLLPEKKLFLVLGLQGGEFPVQRQDPATGGAWDASGERFVYWNDNELRIYDAKDNIDAFVTRVSTPVIKAFWHPTADLLVFATAQAVSTIDRPADGEVQVTRLAEFSDLVDVSMTKNGAEARFIGTIGHQSGVWRLKLK